MIRFVLRRLLEALPVLFIIAALTFVMVRQVPGGPFDREKEIPAEVKQALNAYYGLDQPLGVQFLKYLKNLVQGDLGPSFKFPGWTVNELIAEKAAVSLELGILALLVALVLGMTAGVIASMRPNSWTDHLPMSAAMAGICLPTFVLGPLLLLAFALKLDFFNAMGWYLAQDRVLPVLTLGLFYAAYIARLTRGSMLEVRNQDYIRTAHAKGLSVPRVYLVHGLRNALAPVVSYLGPAAAGLVSGSFVVETIFQIPGLGRFFVSSALDSDYTLVMGCVLFYAALLIVFNLLADIVLVLLNPRLKFQ